VYLPRVAIRTATDKGSHVYSISLFTFHMKVSIHTASLEIVLAHCISPVTGLMAQRLRRPLSDFDAGVPWLTFCEFYLTCTISVYNIRNKGFPSNIISVGHKHIRNM